MKAAIDIAVPHAAWSQVSGVKALCRRAALAALAAAQDGEVRAAGPVELSIMLADDATLRNLNRRFRGIDKPTNVLSFPALDDAPRPSGVPMALGDVAVAFETCVAEAKTDGKTLPDHLAHLIVHGVLHLRGYDHELTAEAERMEALETAILAGLGVADPYDVETAELVP